MKMDNSEKGKEYRNDGIAELSSKDLAAAFGELIFLTKKDPNGNIIGQITVTIDELEEMGFDIDNMPDNAFDIVKRIKEEEEEKERKSTLIQGSEFNEQPGNTSHRGPDKTGQYEGLEL